MLKCALALLVVAAAIDATQAAGHVVGKTACDKVCEDAYTAAGGDGRERRAGHAAIKTTCLATCQTDFNIADAKGKCDEVCQAAFDGVRSRRADHAFAQTLCNAKCTAAQDVSLAAQAAPVCGAVCQATFDAAAAAATAAAGGRSRRAGHAAAQGTCDAGCATVHSEADKMACDNVCDAEFNKAESTAVTAATAAAATLFCSTYDTTCGASTASKFGGSDAGEMTAACETWYGAAEAGVVTAGAAESGATKACYQYHLSVAVDAGTKTTHCTHARGDSVCKVARNRRAGHSVAKDTCDAACGTTLVASAKMACDSVCDAEFAFADDVAKAKEGTRNRRAGHAAAQTACKALCLTPMSDDDKAFFDYNMKMQEFATDPKALKDFLTSEAAKCDCAVSTGLLTVCGSACTLSEASSGTFASSAAAVVIAGLAAALY